jgi:hypothetical protein
VHGRGFESLPFRGHQWLCSAWSWVRIFDILGVNGGVVHGRGFESLTFWGQWWRSAWVQIFNPKCSIIHSILHGSIQQLHCIQPISRLFISCMDPFMDMRGY